MYTDISALKLFYVAFLIAGSAGSLIILLKNHKKIWQKIHLD